MSLSAKPPTQGEGEALCPGCGTPLSKGRLYVAQGKAGCCPDMPGASSFIEMDRNASHPRAASPLPVQTEQCDRCQGNGEIITDWDRYLGPEQEGDEGDEGTAECPDCNGSGRVNRSSCQPTAPIPHGEGQPSPTHGVPSDLLALLKTDRDNAIKDGAQSAGVFVETLDRVIGWIEDSVASQSPSAQVSPSRVSERSSEAG